MLVAFRITPASRITPPLLYSNRVPGVSRIGQSRTNFNQSHRQLFNWNSGDPSYGSSPQSRPVLIVNRSRRVIANLRSSTLRTFGYSGKKLRAVWSIPDIFPCSSAIPTRRDVTLFESD